MSEQVKETSDQESRFYPNGFTNPRMYTSFSNDAPREGIILVLLKRTIHKFDREKPHL